MMLVKFLRTYTGGGLGSINYLLNERKAAGTARVIKGDENLTRAIIKGITYKQKTCFGVLLVVGIFVTCLFRLINLDSQLFYGCFN